MLRSGIMVVGVVLAGCGTTEGEPGRVDGGAPDVVRVTRDAGRDAAVPCDSGEPGVFCTYDPPFAGQGAANVPSGLFLVDSLNLYFAGWKPGEPGAAATILKLPRAGGSATVLATREAGVDLGSLVYRSPVSRGGYVYWVDFSSALDARILRVPTNGGPVETVVSRASIDPEIGVDDTNLYWHDSSALLTTSQSGGDPVTLAAGSFTAIVLDDRSAYVTDGAWLLSIPKHGGAPRKLVAVPPAGLTALTLAGSTLFFISGRTILSLPTSGAPAPTVVANLPYGPTQLLADTVRLFWTDYAGDVFEPSPDGGPAMTLVKHSLGDSPVVFLTPDGTLYWGVGDQVRWLKP